MSRRALLALLIGLGLATTLIVGTDAKAVLVALRAAGWGVLIVVALHLPQIWFSGLGWRALLAADTPVSSGVAFRLRWLRESVNALLPVAQIGGEMVRARLFAARGAPLPLAAASCVVDLTVEMAAQIVFTLAGAIALIAGAHDHGGAAVAIGAVAALALVGSGLFGAQRLGLLRLIEPLIERGGHWARLGDLSGLHEAVLALYRRRAALLVSGTHHLTAWLLGAVETYAALAVLGLSPHVRDALVIEALGQAVRGAGFLIPGALGIQEGGYLLICALFAIPAPNAIALSLIRRIRELTLGLPGLVAWHYAEQRREPDRLIGDAA